MAVIRLLVTLMLLHSHINQSGYTHPGPHSRSERHRCPDKYSNTFRTLNGSVGQRNITGGIPFSEDHNFPVFAVVTYVVDGTTITSFKMSSGSSQTSVFVSVSVDTSFGERCSYCSVTFPTYGVISQASVTLSDNVR